MQMRRHQSRIRLGFHWIIAAATVLIAAVDRPAAAQPIAGLTTTAGALRDVTPQGTPSPTNPTGLDPLVAATRGIRAAATVGNLVIMAGPSLLGGLNFFFFQADTAQFLGSGTLPGYDNIRQFLNVGDQ